jgi:anti-anti-sigma factor
MDNTHKVSSDVISNIPVLIIEGDMTSDADHDVMRTYLQIKEAHSPKNLIINFERTNYINSAGIATLINIIQDIGETGGRISFVGLSNHFLKVMDIVGISDFVDTYGNDDEALAQIKAKKKQ